MNTDIENAVHPSLWRRLAAIFYDAWLVVAIWLVGVTADTFVRDDEGLGIAISHLPLQVYLLAAPAVFFCWFWTHGGQTLGMRAWRLKLLAEDGAPATWPRALLRYITAWLSLLAAGLGYLWILIDHDRLAWHDRMSQTRLVMLSKN